MRAGFLLSYPSRQGNRESEGECRRWKKAGFTADPKLTSCSKNKIKTYIKCTGGPPHTRKSLTQFPLPWFLAYVPASGGFSP